MAKQEKVREHRLGLRSWLVMLSAAHNHEAGTACFIPRDGAIFKFSNWRVFFRRTPLSGYQRILNIYVLLLRVKCSLPTSRQDWHEIATYVCTADRCHSRSRQGKRVPAYEICQSRTTCTEYHIVSSTAPKLCEEQDESMPPDARLSRCFRPSRARVQPPPVLGCCLSLSSILAKEPAGNEGVHKSYVSSIQTSLRSAFSPFVARLSLVICP